MKLKSGIFILFLLLLFACSGLNRTGSSGKGVTVQFVEVPPQELFENEPFSATVLISNYLVNEEGIHGELCLRDTLSSSYEGIPDNACVPVNLPSALKSDKGTVNPTLEEISFPESASISPYTKLERGIDYTNIPIIADFKYEASTTAGAIACVKKPRAVSSTIPPGCGTKQNLAVQQADMPLKISRLTATPARTVGADIIRLDMEIVLSKAVAGQLLTKGNVQSQTASGSAEINF